MDANGTRYHLLFGPEDWAGCSWSSDGQGWQRVGTGGGTPLEYDSATAQLMLRRQPIVFDSAPADRRPDLARDRRGVAADRFGSWYWINAAGDGLRVRSVGSGATADFWPVPDPAGPFHDGGAGFADATPQDVSTIHRLAGAAVTEDHFLVVGSVQPAGLLVFDLYAGGPPRQLLWPTGTAFTPWALTAASGGGVWVLDRSARQLWRLDRHFDLARVVQAQLATPTFGPDDGSAAVAPTTLRVADPIALTGIQDPIALSAIAEGTVFVLDGGTADATIFAIAPGGPPQTLPTAGWLQTLAGNAAAQPGMGLPDPRRHLAAYDMALVEVKPDPTDEAAVAAKARLFIADAGGNQAWAFDLTRDRPSGSWTLKPLPSYLPMRRFSGKGLAVYQGQAHYDFAESWVPLVPQPQPRHAPQAWLLTPHFDGRDPQCVWHRVFIDGAVPPECVLRVWSRASDDEALLDQTDWQQEPAPYRRSDGSELPGRPAPLEPRYQGEGTWELLLQRTRGRHLQLRLLLQGNQRHSPRLVALRVYYPRFSYLERYLPALYRDDAGSATFLEGFLANIEGFYTTIEDRIAAAGQLFDWRSAPPEALEWLASWIGVALDPAWDEPRRRLFIRHAMLFFQYRGTVHGLRLALSLALDETIDETRFDQPDRNGEAGFGVRLIEKFRTRQLPDVLFGDASQLQNDAAAAQAPWLPIEGGDALLRRYLQACGPFERAPTRFPLVAPAGEAAAAAWASFCESVLGFVPFDSTQERRSWQDALAATYVDIARLNEAWRENFDDFDQIDQPTRSASDDWVKHQRNPATTPTPVERLAWQAFLSSRYGTAQRLNAAWNTQWPALDVVPVPDRLPPDGAALEDWFQFEGAVLAIRASAHRFSVLLPMAARGDEDPALVRQRLELARRIVALEKPAHTVFSVRYYWAMFRVGEARLGIDTLLDEGVRARLMSPFVLGHGHLGLDFVAPTLLEQQCERALLGRERLGSGELQ